MITKNPYPFCLVALPSSTSCSSIAAEIQPSYLHHSQSERGGGGEDMSLPFKNPS